MRYKRGSRYKRRQRWDKGLRGWIVTTAKKNLWRVASWYTLEDLIQDGYVCYLRCQQRYDVKDQAHFMALVKVTFINEIHDLATKSTRTLDSIVSKTDIISLDLPSNKVFDPDKVLARLMPPVQEEQTFNLLLHQLPSEIQELFSILMSDAKSISHLRWPNGVKETTNEYFCRMIGADPKKLKVEQTVRSFLSDSGQDKLDLLLKTWNNTHLSATKTP